MSPAVQMDVDSASSSSLPVHSQSEPEVADSSSATPARTASSESTTERPASGASRLEKVSARDLGDFKDGLELVWIMCGAIHAHKKLHECAGILHGDINPNTIVALDTEDGKVEGALIDYDMPMCRAAMRKLAKPDPVVPPPAPPRQFYMPAYYH